MELDGSGAQVRGAVEDAQEQAHDPMAERGSTQHPSGSLARRRGRSRPLGAHPLR